MTSLDPLNTRLIRASLRRVVVVVLFTASALWGAAAVARAQPSVQPAHRAEPAKSAALLDPIQPDLREISAQTLSQLLDSLRGRVVVLNVWATWCVPCVEEFPDLVRLRSLYRSRGVELVLISADRPADLADKVRPFLRAHTVDFTTWFKKPGHDQDFIEAVHPEWGGPIPVTVVYGRNGTRTALIEGKTSMEEFSAAVEDALKQKSPEAEKQKP